MVALAGGVWAEHGGTPGFEARSREAREAAGGKVSGERLQVSWDQDALFFEKPGGVWVKVTLADGKEEVVEQRPDSAQPKPDGGDRRRGRRGPPGGPVSPDKAWKVAVKDGKVALEALADGGEPRSIEIPMPTGWVLNGDVLWSPKSDRFVVWRRPDVPVRQVHYVRSSPKDQLQPEHFTKTYPKPGDVMNVPRAVVCFTDGREPMLLDETLTKDPYELRRHRWREDGERLTLEFVERGLRHLPGDRDRHRGAEPADRWSTSRARPSSSSAASRSATTSTTAARSCGCRSATAGTTSTCSMARNGRGEAPAHAGASGWCARW